MADTRFLADDLLEGRAPASQGDELSMRYIATRFESLGLAPMGDMQSGGTRSWIQRVPLVGLREKVVMPPVFRGKAGELHLQPGQDIVVAPGGQGPHAKLDAAPLVFVGYGIVAPEEKWDDYAGIDVRGKVVVVMNNDPASDPRRFGGTTRLYYGRWDYKYAEAARHGAAGCIIIHTQPSAGYPWQVVQTSWSGEAFELPAGDEPRVTVRMWITEQRAKALLALGGIKEELPALFARAEQPGFHAIPLDVKLSVELAVEMRRVQTGNVLAMLPGSDPKLAREVIVVSAHHDHLGKKGAGPGDTIYNGALDNASGIGAMLQLATGLVGSAPRRSILFASVGAEEQGLLGSAYLCAHPPVPAGRMAANLNIDEINVWGKTHDVTYIGMGKSSLDDMLQAVAKEMGRTVVPDQFRDRGSFYRSDQLNFARIGVPALHLVEGTDFAGHDRVWGRARVDEFIKQRYHQPSDQVDDTWKLDGAIDDLALELVTLLRLADAPTMPTWRPGDEFEKARVEALRAEGAQ
ncbi:MAG: M28 family peptidase [Polyangia bacterium]